MSPVHLVHPVQCFVPDGFGTRLSLLGSHGGTSTILLHQALPDVIAPFAMVVLAAHLYCSWLAQLPAQVRPVCIAYTTFSVSCFQYFSLGRVL